MSSKFSLIEVAGRKLKLSNLDKPLYPSGFTKGEIIKYYSEISPFLLPHIKDRLLTMKRYPEGTGKDFFYEKKCPSYKPQWLKTGFLPSERRGKLSYCLVNDLPSLLWVANLASLEFHVLLSRTPKVETPTMMVFDLDPGQGATLMDCAKVALTVRKLLEEFRLQSFAKTSGGKGLHFYVPLNKPHTFHETKAFARSVAVAMEKKYPDKIISRMIKSERTGKILIDWSQNDTHKTTVSAYSLRARNHPTVSTPLDWDEVRSLAGSKAPDKFVFESKDVLKRVQKYGDLFRPVSNLKQKLPKRIQT